MKTGCSVRVSAAVIFVACASGHAGIIVGQGSVGLWGREAGYVAWDVRMDPAPGIIGPTEGRPFGLEFAGGRLFMSFGAYAIDGGPTSYITGVAGDLSAPLTTSIINVAPPDPRRWYQIALVTANTSGAGYGAFSGQTPALVTYGADFAQRQVSTLTPSGTGYALGALASPPFPSAFAQAIEYVPALDQFLLVGGEENPSVSAFRFHPHTADGLQSAVRSFNGLGGVRGVQSVSSSFAESLLGRPVGESALLCLVANQIGASLPPQLVLYSLTGDLLGATDLLLPGYESYPSDSIDPRSIAVDERNGRIFVGDRAQARIYALAVPAPSVAALGLLAGVLGAARRRRPAH